MKANFISGSVLAALSLLAIPASQAGSATNEELLQRIEALEAQLKSVDEKVEITGEMVSQTASSSGHGAGYGANKSRTRVGGYGEMHYNNLTGEGTAKDKKELDFHRFVLFFGHDFSDSIRFNSELEVEHTAVKDTGNGSSAGEVELEQAYLEFDLNESTQARAGIFLVPVGILNETHEPPTFYGTERNPVEKNIIPVTWWEGGAMLSGRMGDSALSYDVALTSGLDMSTQNKVRDGRASVSEAPADSGMFTGRLKWTGLPGVELAATMLYQGDYTQGKGPGNSATLLESHAVITRGPFTVKALYATWDLKGKANGYNKQTGWYIEPSFKLNKKIGLFTRYNVWDNQAGDSSGSKYQQTNIGVNFWPHEDVVLKADYQVQDNDNGNNLSGFNLGVGYMF